MSTTYCRFAPVIAVALAALAIACGQKTESTDTAGAPAVVIDTVLSADSVPIYYEIHGSGEPALVFVHGWGIDGGFFNHQVEAFDDSFTVIVLDLAGHGRSGHNRVAWDAAAYAADVNAVLDAAAVPHAVLFGHSMGGVIIAAAAAARPERVIGVVGIDTYHSFREQYPPDQVDEFLAPFHTSFDSTVAAFAYGMLPPNVDSAIAGRIIASFQGGDTAALIPTIHALLTTDASPIFASLSMPVRAINADTYATRVDSNRTLAPSFEVKIMTGVGHFPFLERPDEFNRLVRETVADLAAPKQP